MPRLVKVSCVWEEECSFEEKEKMSMNKSVTKAFSASVSFCSCERVLQLLCSSGSLFACAHGVSKVYQYVGISL